MIAEEMNCTVTEAKSRVTPQEFFDKITYWETHPPMRDHLNICMAQIAQSILNTNLGKGQKPYPLNKLIIDYKKALLPTGAQLVNKIKSVFGALTKKAQ